ncbi:Hypothetical protein A7982_11498 [Minicystis rosea]|nr:Hypothetical protein A7982_11498 [Minicystis rosea]
MGGVNVGEVEGEAEVKGDRFEYQSGRCHLVFVRVDENTIRAEEDSDACGGLNVTFGGMFTNDGGPHDSMRSDTLGEEPSAACVASARGCSSGRRLPRWERGA